MGTATAWSGRANERSAHKIAEKIAKSAGVDLDSWIAEAVAEYAEDLGVDPRDLNERERLEAIEERIDRLATQRRPARSEPAPRPAVRGESRPARRDYDDEEEAPRRAGRRRDEESVRETRRSRLDEAVEEIEKRAARAQAAPREAAEREAERGRVEAAIAEIEARAQRSEERTVRALEALSGLVETRGVERSRLEQAVGEIEIRAERSEERTARALQSLSGLVEARGADRERLEAAIAEVEARAEKNAERTARALETMSKLVETRQAERERLEAALERIGKRAEDSEARAARALETLNGLAAAERPKAVGDDAVTARFDALSRRAARAPEPAAATGEDDETFRLVAERLARRRRQRSDSAPAPEARERAAPADKPKPPADELGAAVGDMRRELRRLADRVETLSTPKPAEPAPEPAPADPAIERLERQIANLAERVERATAASPAEAPNAAKAVAEARAEVESGAPAAALQAAERRLEALAARVEAAARRPSADPRPLEDLARRVETIRATIERQGAARPDSAALAAALSQLDAKLDRAATTGSQSAAVMTSLQGMIARLEEALQRPAAVSLDAKPIEDLARRIDGVRGLVERQGGLGPKVDRISADLGELKQKAERPAAGEIARLEAALRDMAAQVETALGRSQAVDFAPIEDLARRIDAMRRAVESNGALSPQVERLEAQLADIRARLDRPQPHPQIDAVDAALRQLAARIEEAVARPAAGLDPKAIEELARRIDGVKSVVERQDRFAPHAARLEAALREMRARMETLSAGPDVDGALRHLAARVEEAASRPATVDARHAERMEAALGEIRAKLDRPAPQVDAALRQLAAKVEEAARRPAAVALDPRPLEELARRIDSMKGALEGQDRFGPHAEKLEAALDDIRAKLDRPAPQVDAALRQLVAKVEEAASRPGAVAVDARPLEELARRIDGMKAALEGQDRFAPHVARLEAALGDIRARIDASGPQVDAALRRLTSKVEEAVSRPTTVALDPKPIEDLARRIESVRESLERPPALGPQVERLHTALGAVAEKLDRATPVLDANGINSTLASMNALLEEAFRRPPQVEFDREPIDALAAQVEAVRETVERQSEQFDGVGRPIDELGRRLDTLQATMERQAARFDPDSIGETIRSAVQRLPVYEADRGDASVGFDAARIEDLLEQAVARLDRPGVEPADLAAVAGAVADLAARVESAPVFDPARLEDLLRPVVARLDRYGVKSDDFATLAEAVADLGDRIDRSGPAPALEDLARDIALRLEALEDRLESAKPSDEGFAHLELAVRELTEKLGESRVTVDTRGLEQEIRVLQDRMEDVADGRMSGAFAEQTAAAIARDLGARLAAANPDALIGQLQDIHERLDRLSATHPNSASLERAMVELTDELEAFRAAREAVTRGAATLTEMRAEQMQFDRRMDARFSGVQDILEKLLDRLARLERDGPADPGASRPQAPTAPRAPSAPARAAMLEIPDRAEGETRPAAAAPLAAEIAAQGRARDVAEGANAKSAAINAHIAAARRAANAAAATSDRREEMEAAAKSANTGGGLAQRAQALFNQHRRPVLLGAAGAMTLLTGVAVLELRGHTPMRKSQLDAPSSPSTPLGQLPTAPQDAMSAALDTTPTGTLSAPPKVISAPLAAPSPLATAAPKSEEAPAAEAGPKPPSAVVAALPASVGNALAAAGANGDIGAEVEIAQRYLEGRTVPRDPKTASVWLQSAADAGSAFAQFRLGVLYEKGVGVTRDLAKARDLYGKAAAAGNARAMHNLAVINAQDGGAGKPDYTTALYWFRRAATFGVRDSQFNLGVLYGRGLGATQDLAASWMWFSLAAKQGDGDAARKRDEVANRMDGKAMAAAKAQLDGFKVQTPEPAVNDPPPAPASAASDAPTPDKAGEAATKS